MKKICLALLFFTITVMAGCGNTDHGSELITTYFHADWLFYDNVFQLSEKDVYVVVRGEVIGERVGWFDTRTVPNPDEPARYTLSTFYEIRLLEVFQGASLTVGDVIEIKETGGQLGNERWVNDDQVMFNIGDDVILFLLDFRAYSVYRGEDIPFVLLNPWQAVYHITPSPYTLSATNALYMPSIVTEGTITSLPGNHITLTPSDLRTIAQNNNIPAGMAISRQTLARE